VKRIFDENHFSGLQLFCMAVEEGSFTMAANAAGLTPAAVSRSISRLEDRLGVRLFVRTTRTIRLTDNGQRYYEKCRDALSQVEEAGREVSGGQVTPAGRLRISATSQYAHARILPVITQFQRLYPDVSFDIHLGNRNVDLINDNYDLAIRMRPPKDSTLIARKLEDVELALVASPAYLKRAGTPKNIEDLGKHECIQFELPSTGRKIAWTFLVDGKQVSVETAGTYHCMDDLLGIVTLAKLGAGIAHTYRFIFEKEIDNGELIELLPEYGGTSRPAYILYPHARHMPLRVRAFIDFLMAKLAPPS
jgi:DNA-binding transcriptional LysR family regulator